MPKAAENNVDTVNGGTQRNGPQSTTFVAGQLWCVVGWKGDSHPPCPLPPIHCSQQWTMVQGSPTTFIEGIPVCRAGDLASCGHPTTGTPNVKADG
jgi:uncharacterized Zn-binding protein involved in type VI secretion